MSDKILKLGNDFAFNLLALCQMTKVLKGVNKESKYHWLINTNNINSDKVDLHLLKHIQIKCIIKAKAFTSSTHKEQE